MDGLPLWYTASDMTKHVLEALAQTNPEAEIWWDSSPLIYPSWKKETLAKDPDPAASGWGEMLTRFYDEGAIASQGKMGFRGGWHIPCFLIFF